MFVLLEYFSSIAVIIPIDDTLKFNVQRIFCNKNCTLLNAISACTVIALQLVAASRLLAIRKSRLPVTSSIGRLQCYNIKSLVLQNFNKILHLCICDNYVSWLWNKKSDIYWYRAHTTLKCGNRFKKFLMIIVAINNTALSQISIPAKPCIKVNYLFQ